MNYRMGDTGREMVASGQWVKVGRHHYRHVSGAEVSKDASGWIVSTQPGYRWERLWVARSEVEKAIQRPVR